MTPRRVFLADDEAPARRKLRRMIEAAGGWTVAGEAADGTAALDGIRRLQPDLALLDVQMPAPNGLELAALIRQLPQPPLVVFVTAHDAFALRAFELHACDYLLKPYDQRRLSEVLGHARARLDLERPLPQRLPVEDGPRTVLLDIAELDWAAAAGNYVELHTASGRTLLTRATLESLVAQLDAAAFVRLNRSALVRRGAVVELRRRPHGECLVKLRNGKELIWTRRFRRGAGPLVPPTGPLIPK
ncbi:MAG TPA: LytTR family DNA-binding domain-containing protein [Terriglobales bacterium]|nr:LytTR family DNA-binding domain-containing protein [Terriglobales bacterium]